MPVCTLDGYTIDFGTVLIDERQAMPTPCKGPECPFVAAAAGRDYLAPGRLDGIKLAVAFGRPFHCHKTTGVTGGKKADYKTLRQCAGSLEWLKSFAADNAIPVRTIPAREPCEERAEPAPRGRET